MEGLAGYILRRLLFLPLTLLVVSFATFYVTRWGPGDPISVYSGQFRDEEAFERVREQYGLDEPIIVQYGVWLEDVALRGDFGPSYRYRDRSIGDVIWPKIWVSVRVASYAFLLTFLIGIPVGMFAALRQGTWKDSGLIGTFLFFDSIPSLVSVPTLVLVLSAKLHWLPPGGFDGLVSTSMIIPTIALTLPAVAGIARLTRTAMLGVMHEDFVRTARAKGLDERVVVLRHAARISVLPVMTTVVGLSLAGMLGGVLFTEILLGIPGIGSFLYEAVRSQDYNVILAMVVLLCTAFVIANLVVDVALLVIDPRVRAARGGR